jgi:hypothetical protein
MGCFIARHGENSSDLCDLKDILPKMRRQGGEQGLREDIKKEPCLTASRLESRLFKSRKGSFSGTCWPGPEFYYSCFGRKGFRFSLAGEK